MTIKKKPLQAAKPGAAQENTSTFDFTSAGMSCKAANHASAQTNGRHATPAEMLITKLDAVACTGSGKWVARCPAHDDRHPSLAVRELADGRVLVHCFAGCDVNDILNAVGLDVINLFPAPSTHEPKGRETQPFPASDVLRCLAFDALVIAASGKAVLAGKSLLVAEFERLMIAVARFQAAQALVGGRRHG